MNSNHTLGAEFKSLTVNFIFDERKISVNKMEEIKRNNLKELLSDESLADKMAEHLKNSKDFFTQLGHPNVIVELEGFYISPEEAVRSIEKYKLGNAHDRNANSAILFLRLDTYRDADINILYGEELSETELDKKYIIILDKVGVPEQFLYRVRSGVYKKVLKDRLAEASELLQSSSSLISE